MTIRHLRVVDSLVAEHLMGYERGYWDNSAQKQIDIGWFDEYQQASPASGRSESFRPIDCVPCFSGKIEDAWKVAEKLRVGVRPGLFGQWEGFWTNPAGYGELCITAITAPLAICLAALGKANIPIPGKGQP